MNRPEAQGSFNSTSCDIGVKSTISLYPAMQVMPTALQQEIIKFENSFSQVNSQSAEAKVKNLEDKLKDRTQLAWRKSGHLPSSQPLIPEKTARGLIAPWLP